MPLLKLFHSKHQAGVCLILVSTLGFGLMQIFVSLTSRQVPVMEQTFFRNLVCLIVVGWMTTQQHVPFWGEQEYWPHLFFRSLFGFLGVVFLFYALRNATQADVTIVTKTDVFATTAASVIFLKEKITKVQLAVMLTAFLGAFIAVNPTFDSSALPLLAALGSALSSSVAYALLSYFAGRVHPLTIVLNFCLFSTLAGGALMIPSFVVPSPADLFCLLMIGVFAAIGQVTMTCAYLMAPAGEISIYSQAAILINALLGLIFLQEVPSLRTILGGLLVVAASIVLFLYKEHPKKGSSADG
ncbi:DMT family transporter [Faecalispora anaeroviscerum]|uniref:DMT family transporter n=1 Tax=Faecalispora anaeroviscerum TaxID=2991836 RepID=UPI0024BB1294|nr:DMT family transporter [Faecalispora anaeroviscerum]